MKTQPLRHDAVTTHTRTVQEPCDRPTEQQLWEGRRGAEVSIIQDAVQAVQCRSRGRWVRLVLRNLRRRPTLCQSALQQLTVTNGAEEENEVDEGVKRCEGVERVEEAKRRGAGPKGLSRLSSHP